MGIAQEVGMATFQLHPVYDPFLDFIFERATAEEILGFELPQVTRERAIELLDRQDNDELSDEEADELEQMRQVNRMVSALKARALATKKGHSE
jgi:hypothetical protein